MTGEEARLCNKIAITKADTPCRAVDRDLAARIYQAFSSGRALRGDRGVCLCALPLARGAHARFCIVVRFEVNISLRRLGLRHCGFGEAPPLRGCAQKANPAAWLCSALAPAPADLASSAPTGLPNELY